MNGVLSFQLMMIASVESPFYTFGINKLLTINTVFSHNFIMCIYDIDISHFWCFLNVTFKFTFLF